MRTVHLAFGAICQMQNKIEHCQMQNKHREIFYNNSTLNL